MKKISIDARMWCKNHTGIGTYIKENFTRIFDLMPNVHFYIFVNKDNNHVFKNKNVTKIIVREKIYSFLEQVTFCYKLLKINADLTIFPNFNVPLFFYKKFIVVIHDLIILSYQGKKKPYFWHMHAYKASLRHAIHSSEKIISVSNFTKNEIIKFYPGINPEKIKVIYNGIDKDDYIIDVNDEIREIKDILFDFRRPYFLVSGVWREHKNILNVVKAFEKFKKNYRVGSLIITGEEDSLYSETSNYIKNSYYKFSIFKTGFVSKNVKEYLFKTADTLVFASLMEGFGLPVLEAMKNNTVVVCSDNSSLPEVCGFAGILCDPKSVDDIYNKMCFSVATGVKAFYIKKGIERVKDFSWEKSAVQLKIVIQENL